MAWGAIAAAGLSALGGIIGNKLSAGQQYNYQKSLQESQQNWLEEMSNTAHQREMEDLRNAGLNPLLTAMGGSGASTPTSGMGNVGLTDDGGKIQNGISTAIQLRQQKNQDIQTKAQVNNLNAQTDTEATKQKVNIAEEALKKSETLLNNKNLTWFDKKQAMALRNMGSQILLNEATASANQMNAKSRLLEVSSANELRNAEKIYTEERSRGYNIYDADTWAQLHTSLNEKSGRWAINPFRKKLSK